jgi:hypothetical protein
MSDARPSQSKERALDVASGHTDSIVKRLTFQPYLFALAFLALVAKVAYSLATQQKPFDLLLGAFVAVFLVSSLLYWSANRPKRMPEVNTIRATISTGKISNSEVLGATSSKANNVDVKVNAGDVGGSSITGYREQP